MLSNVAALSCDDNYHLIINVMEIRPSIEELHLTSGASYITVGINYTAWVRAR